MSRATPEAAARGVPPVDDTVPAGCTGRTGPWTVSVGYSHRKGATRAFGPGAAELPPEYQKIGQPVLVRGSMGTASWVLVGTEASMLRSFGSSCHGAGRVMSRAKAKKEIRGDRLRSELESSGIRVRAGSLSGLAEEAPAAYKDVDEVVETMAGAGIARKVARLRPVAVIKC